MFRSYDHHQAGNILISRDTQQFVLSCQCLKIALQWYFSCFCVASVTKTFKLEGVQTVHRSRRWIVCTHLSVSVFVTLATL
jgi:hypothetical protein